MTTTDTEVLKVTPTKKLALYAAIGTLIVGAGITVWAIIANPPGDTVGKAILTLVLLAGFSFATIGEASSDTRPGYVTGGRIALLVGIVAGGLALTWIQIDPYPWADFPQDMANLLVIIILLEGVAASLLLGHPRWVRVMTNPISRASFNFGFVITIATTVLLSVPLALRNMEWSELYWRIVLAVAVVALVALVVPLIANAILAPKKPKPAPIAYTQPVQRQQIAAGWYSSERPGFDRRWDGVVWTNDYRPAAGLQEAPPSETDRV